MQNTCDQLISGDSLKCHTVTSDVTFNVFNFKEAVNSITNTFIGFITHYIMIMTQSDLCKCLIFVGINAVKQMEV